MNSQYHKLCLILGDQLNASHSWYKNVNEQTLFVIAELHQEQVYTKHHVQKICAFFAAMENFAKALQTAGHHCLHLDLDATQQYANLNALLASLCNQYAIEEFEYQYPDEYRLKQQLETLSLPEQVTIQGVDTEHFLLPYSELPGYFTANQHHKMEFFYRKMRKRFDLLMNGNEPLGGQWNYDGNNRNALKKADLAAIPQPLCFSHDVSHIIKRLKKHNIEYIGGEATSLIWPTSRQQALELLDFFCNHCLERFGHFQDAMTCQHQSQWSLYHSRLSFALNSKLLHPYQVVKRAIDVFNKGNGRIPLASIEGFIRQIIGWREFIRGIYWVNMPSYAKKNTLDAKRTLPDYFWTGETQMKCMQQAIGQSLDYAYAHHIQRLMITGNFCLLAGIDPDQVDQWYLGIYIDAIEWVEMPNTRGMSQFADDGIVATKPYAASGNYINKMSDYCKSCYYQVKEKTGDKACPFNSLYWQFMVKNRELLEKNPRIGMVYRNWDKQSADSKRVTLAKAEHYLNHIEKL